MHTVVLISQAPYIARNPVGIYGIPILLNFYGNLNEKSVEISFLWDFSYFFKPPLPKYPILEAPLPPPRLMNTLDMISESLWNAPVLYEEIFTVLCFSCNL